MANHCATDSAGAARTVIPAPDSSFRGQAPAGISSQLGGALAARPAPVLIAKRRNRWRVGPALQSGLLLAAFGLAACETLQLPPKQEIADLPVYKVGETPKSGGDFITHYPAGRLFAIELSAEGSMFVDQAKTPLLVQLSRDLYVYKSWASFDGKNWTNAHKLFDLRVDGGLTEAGAGVSFEFDAR